MAALQVRLATQTQSAGCRQPQPGSQSHTNHWHGILREILCNIYIINVVALQDYQRELESSTCAQPCGPALPFSDHRHHYITAAISSLLSSHDTPHTSQAFGFFSMIHLVKWLLKKSQGDNAMQRTLPNTFHLHSLSLTTFLSFVIVLTLWILSRWELFSLQILMISSQQT